MDAKSVEERLVEALHENASLKASNDEFFKFFNEIPLPLAIATDPEARVVRVNKTFADLLGIDPNINAGLRGRDAGNLPFQFLRNGANIDLDDLPLFKSIRTNQKIVEELEVVRADGERFQIHGIITPLVDSEGKSVQALAAFADVTKHKKTEQALEKALLAATAANEELQQFTYAASHDLQEPLRSIGSYAQLLQRQYAHSGEANEFATFIVEGVSRMNVLIRDLLTYSRTGAATRRTYVKLDTVVQWSLLNLGEAIRDTSAKIGYEGLPEVLVDETQIVQLFQNLISNALKYHSAAPPEVEITSEQGPEGYTISVRDNGIGIEPHFHKQIFGVFKRLHGREVPGTGIGLALCRKIVEGHRGKIWVESDGKNGSVFRFTLPE